MDQHSAASEGDQQGSDPLPRRLLATTLSGLVRLLGFTFLRVNHFYGACAGYVIYWFAKDIKHVAKTNLRIAFPDASEAEQNGLLKKSLVELGKTMTELGPIWTWGKKRTRGLITKIHGENLIHEARADGRGVIVLVPHFGAWELVGLHLSIEHGIVSLYRPPRLVGIADFVRKARQRFGAKLVPTNLSGVRAIRSSLKQNGVVGILPDQDPGVAGGIRAPFFSSTARTMSLVSRLASKSKCKLVFLAAERLPKGAGYCLHYLPADPLVASQDEAIATAALNRGVESVIALAPEQYLWSYKRFRGKVAGKADPYKQPLHAQPTPNVSERRAA